MQRAGRVDDRRSCHAWSVPRPVHSRTRFVLQYIIVRQLAVSGAIASTCLSYFSSWPLYQSENALSFSTANSFFLPTYSSFSSSFFFLRFINSQLIAD